MIREEKAAERERIRAELARERELAESNKLLEKRTKQQEKEDQLRTWRREVEAEQEHDNALLRIGNESPEVEDREALYHDLLLPHPYEPPDFEAPVFSEAQLAQAGAAGTTNRSSPLEKAQLVAALLAALGGAGSIWPSAPGFTPWVCIASVGIWVVLEFARHSQLLGLRELRMKEAREEAHRAARAEFEKRVEDERENHQSEQAARHAHLRSLQAGDASAIRKELSDMFPLDGVMSCKVEAQATTPVKVALRINVQLEAVMKVRAASLLKSGQPSSKKKTQKRFIEECQRVVAGIALRHASETMLHLPTVSEVETTCVMQRKGRSTGLDEQIPLLKVTYGFQSLAPLQMAEIDPHAALSNFNHEDFVKPAAATLWAEAEE